MEVSVVWLMSQLQFVLCLSATFTYDNHPSKLYDVLCNEVTLLCFDIFVICRLIFVNFWQTYPREFETYTQPTIYSLICLYYIM